MNSVAANDEEYYGWAAYGICYNCKSFYYLCSLDTNVNVHQQGVEIIIISYKMCVLVYSCHNSKSTILSGHLFHDLIW